MNISKDALLTMPNHPAAREHLSLAGMRGLEDLGSSSRGLREIDGA
jgi:hypothetical protein